MNKLAKMAANMIKRGHIDESVVADEWKEEVQKLLDEDEPKIEGDNAE